MELETQVKGREKVKERPWFLHIQGREGELGPRIGRAFQDEGLGSPSSLSFMLQGWHSSSRKTEGTAQRLLVLQQPRERTGESERENVKSTEGFLRN